MSVTKISRGNQPVRIAPKPAATSTEYPLATSVLASTGVMSTFDVQPTNLQIQVAQTQSTRPAAQKSGDSVVQRTLLPSPDVSSGLEVTAQNPSLSSPVVSLTETTPSLQSSGNMVPQNQPPLAVGTPPTSAISNSNYVVAQGQHPVPVVIQNSSTQAIYSSGKSQTQPSLAVAVPQTPPTQAMYGPGKILPQNQSPLVSAAPQTSSTQAFYSPGQILPQNQSQLTAAVSQTPSTQAMYGPGKTLPQSQSQLAAAIPQIPSTSAIDNTGNMVAQSVSPSLGAVNQTSLTPALQIFDDMPPQTGLQTPPPIIISNNASTQPDQSFLNMQSQNQSPILTDFSRFQPEIFPQWQAASPMQQVYSSAGFAQHRPTLQQSTSCTVTCSSAGGSGLTTDGLMNTSHDPFFGVHTSDRSPKSPLNVLADASGMVLQEQTTNSIASSSLVQVQILSIFFVHD